MCKLGIEPLTLSQHTPESPISTGLATICDLLTINIDCISGVIPHLVDEGISILQ